MRFTITRETSGLAGSVSHFASAVRRPVDSRPSGKTIWAGLGSRIERKPGWTASSGASQTPLARMCVGGASLPWSTMTSGYRRIGRLDGVVLSQFLLQRVVAFFRLPLETLLDRGILGQTAGAAVVHLPLHGGPLFRRREDCLLRLRGEHADRILGG